MSQGRLDQSGSNRTAAAFGRSNSLRAVVRGFASSGRFVRAADDRVPFPAMSTSSCRPWCRASPVYDASRSRDHDVVDGMRCQCLPVCVQGPGICSYVKPCSGFRFHETLPSASPGVSDPSEKPKPENCNRQGRWQSLRESNPSFQIENLAS